MLQINYQGKGGAAFVGGYIIIQGRAYGGLDQGGGIRVMISFQMLNMF